jgi:hypothetical protein
MKKIIITAADEGFSDLLFDLLDSLGQFGDPLSTSIGVLDVGLSDASLKRLKNRVDYVVKPDWDINIDDNLKLTKPYLRAFTARPFLNKYFPNYDLYLWLDADTWVQNRFAIDWLFEAASTGSIGIVPQIHQSYVHYESSVKWRINLLRKYFGQDGLNLYMFKNYFNAGVFSLSGNAIHWKYWGDYFKFGVNNSLGKKICDQTPLNYAIWKENLSVHPLPATCNWCCHLSAPIFDPLKRKFLEPNIPKLELGIIHMTGGSKNNIKISEFNEMPKDFKYNGKR